MQDNLILNAQKSFRLSKPALILLVISFILTAILAVVTVTNIDRSQKLMELSFLRQGKTMIHAFEAGTRTSMLFRKATGHNPLEDLAREVLKDKGIAFIRIVDEDGAVIVSEGNTVLIGQTEGLPPDIIGDKPVFSINWSDNIFEIKKHFHPVGSSENGMSMMERRWEHWNLTYKPKGQMFISVGLYTHEYQQTRQQDMYHTIFMLVMLLLLFFAGLYFLFLYQRMGVTYATLLNTRLYANNVLESIPDSLITLDQEGRVVSCNKNAEALLKRPSSRIVGQDILDVFPEWSPETLSLQSTAIEKDMELTVPDGKSVPVKIGTAQLKDHQGQKIGRVLVMRDVGEIHSMQQQLEQSRRLAALGAMAAGIAHEVRNPLGTLRGLAHFFGSEEGASDACREYSKFMIGEVDRLNQLVTELLQFGAPQKVQFEKVDVRAMATKIETLLEKDLAAKEIHFENKFQEDMELYGDADLLLQTVLNLLKNSIQATPPGGTITLDMSCTEESYRISVSDTGSGMSKETMERIFDPFFTTKKSGSGLGLAVSHRIVESHKGYFDISSMENVGTTIAVVLPRVESKNG